MPELAPINFLECDSTTFIERAQERGVDTECALQAYRAVYRHGDILDPALLACTTPSVQTTQHEGDTTKFTLRLDGDGLEAESVILPITTRGGRSTNTLCVSSQVGCAMGCRFCETAQMGLMKHLDVASILVQWFVARHVLGRAIKNIVFMGMGEPMDNLDVVLGAIGILADRNGPGIAPADIAVSTVGHAKGIRRYASFARQSGYRKLKLAVSVNAPNDAIRSQLMPINRATPMSALMEAMLEWSREGTPVLIEYVLIPGVNSESSHARELASYLRPLPCKVNVIPYNPRRDSPWPAPDEAQIDQFYQTLRDEGVFVTRRRTLGRDVMAACGQLGNPQIRRRQFVMHG